MQAVFRETKATILVGDLYAPQSAAWSIRNQEEYSLVQFFSLSLSLFSFSSYMAMSRDDEYDYLFKGNF